MTSKTIVIVGLNDAKKPVAARFDMGQAEAVRRAAALMGLKTAIPKTPEAEQLVGKLPMGKLFAAGRGLVPLVAEALYQQLALKLEVEPHATASPAVPATQPPATDQKAWDALKLGSVCIAPERDALNEGWWPAVVTGVSKDGQKLTLRWRDQPKQPPITVKRQAVGLLLNHS